MAGELVRRRDVTKVRDGGKWRKRIREAPEELDGVGDAFSCSFEPDHDKKLAPRWIFKNSTWFLLLAVDNTITHPAAFSSPPSFPSHAHLISR